MTDQDETDQTPEWTGKHWRYQVIFQGHEGGIGYSLCECHFDEEDCLVAWTECPAIEARGNTVEELRSDLSRMLADSYKWKPEDFDELKVGMKFERTDANVERMIAAIEAAKTAQ